MNYNILRYFMAVYEEKSMTSAARKLFIAQPSLSQGIRKLEEELGVKLFDRSKTPLRVTEAGEIFAHWAKDVLSSEQRMRQYLSDLSSNKLRKLTIGVTPQICREIFPIVAKEFYSATTGCTISIKECRSSDAEISLDSDNADILIGKSNPHYQCVSILKEPIVLAAPALSRFHITRTGEYPSISLSEIVDKPLIFVSENEYFLNIISEMFKRLKSNPNIVLETPRLQEAHRMVSNNIGITFLPEYCIKNNKLPNVRYYTFHDYPLSHEVTVMYRKDRPITEDAAKFISVLKGLFTNVLSPDNADAWVQEESRD